MVLLGSFIKYQIIHTNAYEHSLAPSKVSVTLGKDGGGVERGEGTPHTPPPIQNCCRPLNCTK